MLATVNPQGNEIRKRKLEAFVDNVFDQSAKFIAENLTTNYRSIVNLKFADLVKKAKIVDEVPGKDKTQAERKEPSKETDLVAWEKESTQSISNLLIRDDLEEIATDLGLENISNKTKPQLISERKKSFKKENIQQKQTQEGKKG